MNLVHEGLREKATRLAKRDVDMRESTVVSSPP